VLDHENLWLHEATSFFLLLLLLLLLIRCCSIETQKEKLASIDDLLLIKK
jgi:hypothetical protein